MGVWVDTDYGWLVPKIPVIIIIGNSKGNTNIPISCHFFGQVFGSICFVKYAWTI